MVKVVPKDRWAFAERKRRESSERALKVANMLADRFVGVLQGSFAQHSRGIGGRDSGRDHILFFLEVGARQHLYGVVGC